MGRLNKTNCEKSTNPLNQCLKESKILTSSSLMFFPFTKVFCERNGIRYNLNQEWHESSAADGLSISTRRKCQCRPGSGSQPIVHCGLAQCPQITERHLRPSPQCPVPMIVDPDESGIMCPYVICKHTPEEAGKSAIFLLSKLLTSLNLFVKSFKHSTV